MDTFNRGTEDTEAAGRMNRYISVSSCDSLMGRWWGADRVDFAVQSPHGVGT